MTPDPMKRQRSGRLTPKGQVTRDRIVVAAADLMHRNGVAGTTTEQVQAGAGVSASQLYHYFADKRALVRAVIAYQTEAVVGAQEPLLSSLDCVEALQAWRDHLVQVQGAVQCRGGCPVGSLGSELSELDDDARERVAAAFTRWEQALCSGLLAMRQRGELRHSADPETLALALLTAVQGGLLLSQVRRDVTPLRAGLDVVLDQIRDQRKIARRSAPGRSK